MISGVFVDANDEDEHHRPSMRRWRAFIVGVCLSASGAARADIPAVSEQEARFDLLVRTGNQARLAGRHRDAAIAYKAALEIHPHPVVSGRLGLALLKLGQIDLAGHDLHLAMEHGQGVPLQERTEITAAYDKAKALTTWVSVKISQVGATVTCDGESWNREGTSAFWRFVMPGEHTIRAKLDGYEEAVETFIAKPGERIAISLKLVPLGPEDLTEFSAEVAENQNEKRTFPPYLPTSNIVNDPNYDPREDPSYGEPKEKPPVKKKDGPRFSVNGGVVTVFGVASWNPAVGGVLGVSVKPKEFFSLGIEGRAAWLTTGVAERQISAMTAGGIASVCGHLRWFFGCGLGYVGTINIASSANSYKEASNSDVTPGFGGRIGAEFRLASSFMIRSNVDVIGLQKGFNVLVGETIIVEQPPVLIGAQVSGGWEF
jgi:hypothetical protein